MTNSDLKPKYGIVAMVDALGVRNASIEESIKFAKDIDSLQAEIPAYLKGYCIGFSDEGTRKIEEHPPTVLTFGDTLLLIWEMDRNEVDSFLSPISAALSYLLVEGLERGLLFRGALTVGEYIENNNTVLGPAIADVASWYESSQSIGIIATPYFGQFISRVHIDNNLSFDMFVKYPIVLKGNEVKEFWIVPWPLYLRDNKERKNPISYYYEQILKLSIPKGTEDKFSNTEALIHTLLKEKT